MTIDTHLDETLGPQVNKGEYGGVFVVPRGAESGQIAQYHVADQSTTRSRIELPTGAKSIRVFYSARRSAGVEDATGEALKLVFNIASTSEAGTALAESASAAGVLSGVSYVLLPINATYSKSFPDPDDRLYYVDFLSAVAEAGGSDVVVEVTL